MKKLHAKVPCWAHLTNHAVEQFAARFSVAGGVRNAEEELYSLLNTSKQDGKTSKGDTIYVSSFRPDVRMVVKDRNVCITVLPPKDIEEALADLDIELSDMEVVILSREKEMEQQIQELELSINDIEARKEALKLSIKDEIARLNEEKSPLCNELSRLKAKLARNNLLKRNQ